MLTPRRFLFRSLSHYRGIHLSVALGVAVGTAVLSGALLVGDSVRGSLRDLTLDRLGAIDHAMVTDRYFREDLAEDLAEATNFAYAFERAAPAVLIRGSVEAASSGARASRVNIHGIDERFASFYKEPLPLPKSREVVLNESLAREVGAAAGDSVLLRFQTDTLVPSESVMGRKGDNVRTLRLTVAAVVPNRGPGRFGLSPSQQLPFNAYLPLDAVQRALDQNGRANALFVAGSDADAQQLNGILRDVLTLGDLNLSTRNLSTQGLDESFSLGTDRIVLEIPVAEAAQRAGEKANLDAIPILTYLANTLRAGDREIPYSTVTALGPAPAADSLVLAGSSQRGSPAPTLTGDEMLLNEWAARDLKANVGDAIEMTYYVVGAGGALDTATHRFSLRGIVRLRGLAADRHLAPDYKGMSDTERMGDWDPPFPVDLTKIRPIDEDYWERYRSAPKAFVALETAKSLWTSRFGQLTSIRFAPPDIQTQGQSIERTEATFREAFLRELDPAALGLAFQSVKAQGLAASSGATDFSGLFIGFSLFLIVSAAMLVTLLFRLGVERRAKEIGLLLSTGHPVASVRKLLLAEGALISLAGCLVGLPAAVGYGALMVHGLRTWWSAAVGGSFLELHVGTPSLVGGAVGAFLMMVISIWLSLRASSPVQSAIDAGGRAGRGALRRRHRAGVPPAAPSRLRIGRHGRPLVGAGIGQGDPRRGRLLRHRRTAAGRRHRRFPRDARRRLAWSRQRPRRYSAPSPGGTQRIALPDPQRTLRRPGRRRDLPHRHRRRQPPRRHHPGTRLQLRRRRLPLCRGIGSTRLQRSMGRRSRRVQRAQGLPPAGQAR